MKSPNKSKLIVLLLVALPVAGLFLLARLQSQNGAMNRSPNLSLVPCESELSQDTGLQVRTDPETGQHTLSALTPWYTIIGAGDINSYTLHAFDSAGRHTGTVPNPNPISEFPAFEKEIPNSSFQRFGGEYYLTLDSQDEYQIELHGRAVGKVEVRIIRGLSGDSEASTLRYPDNIVNPSFRASLILRCQLEPLPQLVVDSDGDGKPEARQEALLSR